MQLDKSGQFVFENEGEKARVLNLLGSKDFELIDRAFCLKGHNAQSMLNGFSGGFGGSFENGLVLGRCQRAVSLFQEVLKQLSEGLLPEEVKEMEEIGTMLEDEAFESNPNEGG